jgi:hypothetical protein
MKTSLFDKIHRILTDPVNIVSGALLIFLLLK